MENRDLATPTNEAILYKWIEGDHIQDYNTSASVWKAHSNTS